jgi:hypothetical protein
MAALNTISATQLSRLVGQLDTPIFIDVRTDEDQAIDPRMVLGPTRRDFRQVGGWARDLSGHKVIVVCQHGSKVDRIASPWLLRRFGDPSAVSLFVAPSEAEAVAERFGATPFDIVLDAFGLHSSALDRLALIVRGADTGRTTLAAEALGLLAALLGLSRMYTDDLAQLDPGVALNHAFYRWSRNATGETHDGPAGQVATKAARRKAS